MFIYSSETSNKLLLVNFVYIYMLIYVYIYKELSQELCCLPSIHPLYQRLSMIWHKVAVRNWLSFSDFQDLRVQTNTWYFQLLFMRLINSFIHSRKSIHRRWQFLNSNPCCVFTSHATQIPFFIRMCYFNILNNVKIFNTLSKRQELIFNFLENKGGPNYPVGTSEFCS